MPRRKKTKQQKLDQYLRIMKTLKDDVQTRNIYDNGVDSDTRFRDRFINNRINRYASTNAQKEQAYEEATAEQTRLKKMAANVAKKMGIPRSLHGTLVTEQNWSGGTSNLMKYDYNKESDSYKAYMASNGG